MAAKIGRPTDNPRNIQTRIRLNKDESKMLEYCAKTLKTSKTDVIVKGIRMVYTNLKK